MKALLIKEISKSEYMVTLENGMLALVEAIPEDMDAAGYWWNETDCFANKGLATIFANKSDNPFWFCTIKVTVTDPATLETGVEYLGACNCRNGREFIEEDFYFYFSDMVKACVQSMPTKGNES